jgi:hypothetical protein
MPSHVPRSLQPYSQQRSLERRESQLRRAIAKMQPTQKLLAAAEKVRSAQLLVCKAELELIRYSEGARSERLKSMDLAKRMASIERKRYHWQAITVEEILVQFAI